MIWSTYTCPRCQSEASMGIMSLIARCACGLFYAQSHPDSGWYESEEDFHQRRQWAPSISTSTTTADEPKTKPLP